MSRRLQEQLKLLCECLRRSFVRVLDSYRVSFSCNPHGSRISLQWDSRIT
jgi:hypothetical protein